MKKIAVALLIVFVIFGCAKKKKNPALQNQPSATQLSIAPDFSLLNHDGETVQLSSYRGHVIILDFWATWCGPCRQEIPGFVELYNQYRDKGLVIIGVSLDQQGWKAVKPFMQQFRINYPIVLGNNKVVNDYGGIRYIPTTFIIDRNGKIVEKVVGYHPKSYFQSRIQPLL